MKKIRSLVLGEHAAINSIRTAEVNYHGAVTIMDHNVDFKMWNGAVISDIDGAGIIAFGNAEAAKNDETYRDNFDLSVDGEITNVHGWAAIRLPNSNDLELEIGSNANIHHNTTANGVLYIQGTGIHIDMDGNVHHNTQGIKMYANYGGHSITMHKNAKVEYNLDGGINVARGTLTMEGGSISNNGGSGVSVSTGGIFVMNNGIIENNSTSGIGGGVVFTSTKGWTDAEIPRVELRGGTIQNNYMNATIEIDEDNFTFTAKDGTSNDIAVGTNNETEYNKQSFSHIDRNMSLLVMSGRNTSWAVFP